MVLSQVARATRPRLFCQDLDRLLLPGDVSVSYSIIDLTRIVNRYSATGAFHSGGEFYTASLGFGDEGAL